MQLHHSLFIKTPIVQVLEKALAACRTIGDGIEAYPLGDYILPSVFLNLTGFQEQKLRCICWDAATIDYEFRRDWISDVGKLGEYSSYDAKNLVYKKLSGKLDKKLCDNYTQSSLFTDSNKRAIIDKVFRCMDDILQETIMVKWKSKDYVEYLIWRRKLKSFHFAKDALLDECLKNVYDSLYKGRNRFAHNTVSYQENLPSLRELSNQEIIVDNFFCWFTLLMLIDEIFICLYDAFLEMLGIL